MKVMSLEYTSSTYEKIEKQLLGLARKHGVPCISGATEYRMIQHLMAWKPTHILEVGSAIGWSTYRFARICAERGGQVISFEISHPSYMTAVYHMWRAHITNARLYHANILHAPLSLLCTKPIDLVFIDGAKQEYADYLDRVLPYCAPGAHIICDDIHMYADKVAPIYNIIKQHNLTHEKVLLDDGDGILVITLA